MFRLIPLRVTQAFLNIFFFCQTNLGNLFPHIPTPIRYKFCAKQYFFIFSPLCCEVMNNNVNNIALN